MESNPIAPGAPPDAAAAYPLAPRQSVPLLLRLIFLSYLALYVLPWWVQPPSPAALISSLAGIAVFLPLYFLSYDLPGWRRLAVAAGMLAVGFLLEPCQGAWEVFPIFAASSAAYVRPVRLGALGVAGAVLGMVLFALALRLPAMEWGWSAFVAMMLGAAGLFTVSMKQREEQLALAREDARRYAVLAERERIARDLHDVLGHTLTLVAMKADLAKRLLDSDPESALREVDEIHAAARVSLGELRTALTGMRSTTLAVELVEARRALESAGVALESISPAEPLPPPVETTLAYIIREAATNVLRHARATYCRIHLWREGGMLKLTIQDNGRGGEPVEGQGLRGMRQRLAEVRGTLEVRGGSGFRLEASVPLAPTGGDAVLPLLTTQQATT